MALLYPTYMELIDAANKAGELEGDAEIQSRYPIVLAAAKRARQIVDERNARNENDIDEKPLSKAVQDIYSGAVTLTPANK